LPETLRRRFRGQLTVHFCDVQFQGQRLNEHKQELLTKRVEQRLYDAMRDSHRSRVVVVSDDRRLQLVRGLGEQGLHGIQEFANPRFGRMRPVLRRWRNGESPGSRFERIGICGVCEAQQASERGFRAPVNFEEMREGVAVRERWTLTPSFEAFRAEVRIDLTFCTNTLANACRSSDEGSDTLKELGRCRQAGLRCVQRFLGRQFAAIELQLAATVLHVAATVLHLAATELHVDATELHLDATVLQVEATVLQFDETLLQLEATVLQVEATVLQLEATVLQEAATVPACIGTRPARSTIPRSILPIGDGGICA
jgi:hypothetical protein